MVESEATVDALERLMEVAEPVVADDSEEMDATMVSSK